MATTARGVFALALVTWLGCGARDETASTSATSGTPTPINTPPTASASASAVTLAAATDDQPPTPTTREDRDLVAHTTPDAAQTCGALALPPTAFVLDPEPHAKGGWSYPVGDLDGDRRPEIATTSTAYRSVTGDVYAAVHVEEKPGCFRLIGVAFGSIVTAADALYAWREPNALLIRARGNHAPPRDEIGDYRSIGGRLVLHRTRACFYDGEVGMARCTAWVSAGDTPLTRGRELAIPRDVPAAPSLTPMPLRLR